MKSLHLFFTILSVHLLLLSVTHAAESGSFRILSVVGQYTDIKFEVNNTTYNPSISPRLADKYPLPSGGTLELFKEVPNPEESGEMIRIPVLSIPIPATIQQAIIVLAPTPDGGIVHKVLDDNPAEHPAGTLKVWNLSHYALAQAVNREVIQVAIGDSGSMEIVGGGNLIHIAVRKNGKWETAFRRERKLFAYNRYYALVFDYMEAPGAESDPLPPPALVLYFSEKVKPTL
jgi:hypothetical protein